MMKKGLRLITVAMLGSLFLVSCGTADNNAESKLAATDSEVTATDEAINEDSADSSEEVSETVEEEETVSETALEEKQEGVDIYITERMYTTYINELYTNTEDYLGKTVQIEGIYLKEYYDVTDRNYYYVYREGPGCCVTDSGMIGLEFTWPEGTPEEDTALDDEWVRVIGVLDSYKEDGITYLTLKDAQVTVMEVRGLEVLDF